MNFRIFFAKEELDPDIGSPYLIQTPKGLNTDRFFAPDAIRW